MKTKIGTIDIESFPGTYRAFVDKMWQTSVMKEVTPVKPASFSYKPLGKGKPYTRGVWQYESETEFVKDLHRIFKENTYLIGHNAKRFDLKQSNSFFAMHDLEAVDTKIYDTLTIVKRRFRLPSYRLKYCLVFFGLGEKIDTGGDELWFKTESGDEKKRKEFLKYNENDTVMTEKFFLFLVKKGWAKIDTESRFFSSTFGCPRCKGFDWQKRGPKPTKEGWRQHYFCKTCGKHGAHETVTKKWPDYTQLK